MEDKVEIIECVKSQPNIEIIYWRYSHSNEINKTMAIMIL